MPGSLASAPVGDCARIVGGLRGNQVQGLREARSKSRHSRLLQIVIGLDNLAQLVRGTRVSAIGIGGVNLNQLLEASLDLDARCAVPQVERLQALALERPQSTALLGRCLTCGSCAPRKEAL